MNKTHYSPFPEPPDKQHSAIKKERACISGHQKPTKVSFSFEGWIGLVGLATSLGSVYTGTRAPSLQSVWGLAAPSYRLAAVGGGVHIAWTPISLIWLWLCRYL